MEYSLMFRGPELDQLLNWAKNNDATLPYSGEAVPEDTRGLYLVKDEGIYLMASRNSDGKALSKPDGKPVVSYARWYNPEEYKYRDDLWEATYAVSRDDFAEFIDLTGFLEIWTAMLEKRGDGCLNYLRILFGEDSYQITYDFLPKKRKGRKK